MIIDFKKLNTGYYNSKNYYAEYGNTILLPYFFKLGTQNRNYDSDKLVLNFISYIVWHYELYQQEMNFDDKKKLVFNICRTVSLFNNSIITGKMSSDTIVDNYVIKNVEGFEDNSIFKDLKYLQKLTAYDNPTANSFIFYGKVTDQEIESLLKDVTSSVKKIIESELIDHPHKNDVRAEFQTVSNFPNIFSIAAYYREIQRSEEAIKYLDIGIKYLQDIQKQEIYADKHNQLFLIFKVISRVGEFASQKNMSQQTRKENTELTSDLKIIKKLTDLLVKPSKYCDSLLKINELNISYKQLINELIYLKSGLQHIHNRLLNIHDDYSARENYYTSFLKISNASSFLSAELIDELKNFCSNYFPKIQGDNLVNLHNFFASAKKEENIITKIINTAKLVYEKTEFPIQIKLAQSDKEKLREELEKYKPLIFKHNVNIQEIDSIQQKIRATDVETEKKELTLKSIYSQFKSFISNKLPALYKIDDNPITLNYEKLFIRKDTYGFDKLLISFTIGDNTIDKIYDISAEEVSNLKAAIVNIKRYNDKLNANQIFLPKSLLELGENFITKSTISKECIEKLSKSDLADSIINTGKIMKLSNFLTNNDVCLITEFYIEALYDLCNSNPLEIRALRHGIRHFEDNLEIMEVKTPIEQIYAHYTYKILGENLLHVDEL
jgi:hypothetical protein